MCVFTGTETKKEVKKARKSGGQSGTSSDESNSDVSDGDSNDSFKSVSSGEDEDDFNPFKDDSSEDDEDGENLLTLSCILFTIRGNIQNIIMCLTDPWLIRKDTKKNKEKRNKKKKKSIDPDSIQSALLASGLGTTRPTFTAPAVKPSNNTVPVGKSSTERSKMFAFFLPGDLATSEIQYE